MTPRQAALLVTLAALLATAPVWAPGALLYMDTPCHLLELHALVTRILPEQHWFHGWSDLANAGGDVGGLNAPLAWTPLALLGWAGLPLGLGYRLATVLAAIVAGLGAFALGRRLGLEAAAAGLAGALVAAMPLDTLGIGGGLAGMWPYRLANGLLWLGLAWLDLRRPKPGRIALWLSAVLLCHAYAGVVGGGVLLLFLGEHGLRRRWRHAALVASALGLTALCTLPWWFPQVTAGAASIQEITRLNPLAALALLGLPVRPHDLLTGTPWSLLGGPWSLPASGAVLLGLGMGAPRLRRSAGTWSPLVRRLLIALAGLVLLVMLGGLGLLGPNPWRHLAQGRLALALLAAAGLAPWLVRSWRPALLALAIAVCSLVAGLKELPLAVMGQSGAQVAALEATWRDLARAQPAGRVYHQETFLDPSWSGPLAWSHAGAMLGVAHGLPVLGSWYGVSATPTVPYTTDQGVALFGTLQSVALSEPDWLPARLMRFGADAVVTVEPELAAALSGDQRFRKVADYPPFAAFSLERPLLQPLGLASPEATATITKATSTSLDAVVHSPGPVPFVLRQAWDPGWLASFDGEPLPLEPGSQDGLIAGTLPGSGALELRWRPRSRPWSPVGLLGLLLTAGLAWRERRRA